LTDEGGVKKKKKSSLSPDEREGRKTNRPTKHGEKSRSKNPAWSAGRGQKWTDQSKGERVRGKGKKSAALENNAGGRESVRFPQGER